MPLPEEIQERRRRAQVDYPAFWQVSDPELVKYRNGGVYIYTGDTVNETGLGTPAQVRTLEPMDPTEILSMTQFQVSIQDIGVSNTITIGVCDKAYPTNFLPGWQAPVGIAIGVDAAEGLLYINDDDGVQEYKQCKSGDVMKCAIVPTSDKNKANVEFYCNNVKLTQVTATIPNGGFYGVIGMASTNETIVLGPPQREVMEPFESLFELKNSYISYNGDGICTYKEPPPTSSYKLRNSSEGPPLCIGTLRSKRPIEVGNSLQVKLVDKGEESAIAVGVCSFDYPDDSMPGWKDESIGYHADLCSILCGGGEKDLVAEWVVGDILQCSLEPVDGSSKEVRVVFRKNSDIIGKNRMWNSTTGLYWAVGMLSKNEKVQIILPRKIIPLDIPLLRFEDTWQLPSPNVEYTQNGICVYLGGGGVSDIGIVRSREPINPMSPFPFFDVKIINPGQLCQVALGVCSEGYPLTAMPGWMTKSIGFHCDTGNLYQSSEFPESTDCFCNQGDVVRCMIHPIDKSPKRVRISFYHNGELVASAMDWTPSGGFYALIGMMSENEKIQIACPLMRPSTLKKGIEGYDSQLTDVTFQRRFVRTAPVKMLSNNERKSSTDVAEKRIGNTYVPPVESPLVSSSLPPKLMKDDIERDGKLPYIPPVSPTSTQIKTPRKQLFPNHSQEDVPSTPENRNVRHHSEPLIAPISLPAISRVPAVVIEEEITVIEEEIMVPEINKSDNYHFICLHHVIHDKHSSKLEVKDLNGTEYAYAKYRIPLMEKMCYFEVDLLTTDHVVVGVSCTTLLANKLLGQYPKSVAFDTSSGQLHSGTTMPVHSGVTFQQGDTIGCKVTNLPVNSESVNKNLDIPSQVKVEFYKNASEVASVQVALPISLLHPTICFVKPNSSVKFTYNYKMTPLDYFESHPIPEGYVNFPQPDPLPSSTGWISYSQCEITQDGSAAMISAIPDTVTEEEPFLLQHHLPFSKCDNYFEVELTRSLSNYSIICIGAMPRIQKNETGVPGHVEGSVGFQASTGLIMRNNEMVSSIPDMVLDKINCSMNTFKIGIGVEMCSSSQSIYYFFTVDDQEITKVLFDVACDVMYPTITVLPTRSRLPCIDHTVCKLTFPSLWPCCKYPLAPWGIARISADFAAIGSTFIVNNDDGNTRGFQACYPLSTERPYYEVSVVNVEYGINLSLGLCSLQSTINAHVGLERHSIGYHINLGCIWCDGTVIGSTPIHAYNGVKLGCGIVFPDDGSQDSAEVFYTIDRRLVSKHHVFIPVSGFFPTVCMNGGMLALDFRCPSPFPNMKYTSHWHVLDNVLPSRHSLQAISHAHVGLAQASAVASASSKTYFKVNFPSSHSGRTLCGLSNCRESPFIPKVSMNNCSFFFEITSGTVITIQNGSRKSDECHIPKGTSEFGCGVQPLPNNRSSLVFFTANNQVIYAFTSNLLNIELHPTLCMVGSTTKVEVDTCAIWPLVSSVGFGWGRYYNIKYLNGLLTQEGNNFGFIQSSLPLIPSNAYFEVEIVRVNGDLKKTIAVGLGSRRYNQSQWIGWKAESIAYHSDDGKLYKANGLGSNFGPKLLEGDVVGCGISFFPNFETTQALKSGNRVSVFFTVNGYQIGKPELITIPEGGLFPTVCLESPSEVVCVHLEKQNTLNMNAQWSRMYCVNQAGHILQHTFQGKTTPYPVGYCQSSDPVSDTCNYFEIEVLNCEDKSNISIGIAPLQPINSSKIDTGFVFFNLLGQVCTSTGVEKSTTNSHHKCNLGDTVGCLTLINPPIVQFYHNNIKVMYTPVPEQLLRYNLHPTILLTHSEDVIFAKPHACPPSSIPRKHIGWLRSERVRIKGSIVEYSGIGRITNTNVGVAQMSQPINQEYSYYEIKILNLGECSTMAIGAAALDYPLTSQPGWFAGSIGYHGDDGCLFNVSGTGNCFGPSWKKYDTIGLGIRAYEAVLPNAEVQIFFTYNGCEVGHTTAVVPASGLFPTVGLHSKGERIKINHSAKQSNANVKSYLKWRVLIGVKMEISVQNENYILKFSDVKRKVPVSLKGRTSGLGIAVSYEPFSEKLVYFEVKILKLGKLRAIAIGATKKNYCVDSVPGWLEGSVAYHTDSGSIHIASGAGKLFGPVTAEGDVIGCGVTFLTCSSKYCTMFFTKNGTPIGTRIQVAVPNGGFYPTIGLISSEDKVSVKFMDTFKPSPSKLPVGLMRIHNSSYSDHILMYNGGGNGGPANAQFAVALNTDHNYYSVNIIRCKDTINIGLAPRDYLLSQAPGMCSYSVAYNISNGTIKGVFGHKVNVTPAPKCTEGDTIGCGVTLVESDLSVSNDSNKKKSSYFAFFTKNNVLIHQMELFDLYDDLFPIVGFLPKGNKSAVYMDWAVSTFELQNVL